MYTVKQIQFNKPRLGLYGMLKKGSFKTYKEWCLLKDDIVYAKCGKYEQFARDLADLLNARLV